MKLIKLNCTACGAPISIPDDIDQLNCAVCGSLLYLERGEGYYSLKVAEKLADAIQQSSKNTEDAIRETAKLTQIELRRMQISQNLIAVENKINATHNEQKQLAGQPMNPIRMATLDNLYFQEWLHLEEYRSLQMQMDLLDGPELEKNELALETQINFIDVSLNVMPMMKDVPENRKLRQSLIEEQNLYRGYLFEVKKTKKRAEINSFKIARPFVEDLAVLETQLPLIVSDINRLRTQAPSHENGQLLTELGVLHNQLFIHWTQQVHRQAWHDLNPQVDPGNDIQKVSDYVKALRFEIDHLSKMPNLPRDQQKRLRDLNKQERTLTQRLAGLSEQKRYNEALGQLRKTLTGLAIAAPFSLSVNEVQSQLQTMHSEIKSLDSLPPSPEVSQSRQELHTRYSDLYRHWTGLKTTETRSNLPSLAMTQPFPQDYAAARSQYDIILKDVETLKTCQDFPGLQALKQEVLQKQKTLYAHLLALKKAETFYPV
jgi:tetratricopeptide (TPR) repeat protein